MDVDFGLGDTVDMSDVPARTRGRTNKPDTPIVAAIRALAPGKAYKFTFEPTKEPRVDLGGGNSRAANFEDFCKRRIAATRVSRKDYYNFKPETRRYNLTEFYIIRPQEDTATAKK